MVWVLINIGVISCATVNCTSRFMLQIKSFHQKQDPSKPGMLNPGALKSPTVCFVYLAGKFLKHPMPRTYLEENTN
ncbi:hypothetical protein Trydic_g18972 [Trypoxylus dichotomus]